MGALFVCFSFVLIVCGLGLSLGLCVVLFIAWFGGFDWFGRLTLYFLFLNFAWFLVGV